MNAVLSGRLVHNHHLPRFLDVAESHDRPTSRRPTARPKHLPESEAGLEPDDAVIEPVGHEEPIVRIECQVPDIISADRRVQQESDRLENAPKGCRRVVAVHDLSVSRQLHEAEGLPDPGTVADEERTRARFDGMMWLPDLGRKSDALNHDAVRSVDLKGGSGMTVTSEERASVGGDGEGVRPVHVRQPAGHSIIVEVDLPDASVPGVGHVERIRLVAGGDVPWQGDPAEVDLPQAGMGSLALVDDDHWRRLENDVDTVT